LKKLTLSRGGEREIEKADPLPEAQMERWGEGKYTSIILRRLVLLPDDARIPSFLIENDKG